MKILLVGFGKMGSALHSGWKNSPDIKISVIDPSATGAYRSPHAIRREIFDVIILAVKPQIIDEVCRELVSAGITSPLYISIAAGKTLKFFENILGYKVSIVRSMPNTPAMIGQGMTIGIANQNTNEEQRLIAENLLKVSGKFDWIDDENLMDAVTAISGSGPAYVFLLIEELAKAGMAKGLSEGLAMELARQTVIGSAALAADQADIPASILRQNVTSPGGTTEAALEVLMAENGLGALLDRAVEANIKRSRDLA